MVVKKDVPESPWDAPHLEGLVLRTWRPPATPAALVACMILRCRDLPRLLEHAPSWESAVRRIVFVLGAWSEREPVRQIQQTARTLRDRFPGCDIVLPPARGWASQSEKRSAYFARCQPGELAFVIDADEEVVEGAVALAAAARAAFDVGWVTISAPTRYERIYNQPRFFRVSAEGLMYGARHYWVTTPAGRLVAAHAYGGPGWHHERVAIALRNSGGRRNVGHAQQYVRERRHGEHAMDFARDRTEGLRIVQLTSYDAGLAVYRLHSALNATTRDRSVMLSDVGNNPLAGPWQYDVRNHAQARALLAGADVVHCHLDYQMLTAAGGLRSGQLLVIHHHGTIYRADPERWNRMDVRAQLRLASTMDLLLRDTTGTLQWLPNPVPVALYRRMRAAALRERGADGAVRIAHSPSKPKLKGTADLIAAVERLRAKGLKVQLDLTTGIPHAEALWRKASCDLMFDSFWLGIQVSGLEAAAMGMPVVAGDADTAAAYRARLGAAPYTFAEKDTLEAVLERLVVDQAWRAAEAARVAAYVLEWHDEAAVALRYLDLLHATRTSDRGLRMHLKAQIDAERQGLAKALRGKGVQPTVQVIGRQFRLGPRVRTL
jgi:hypothetical protein